MKKRILTRWTFTRALYVVMGIAVIIQSIISQQWLGIAFGGFFAAMGLFAFGCASGNCISPNCAVDPSQESIIQASNIERTEVK